MIVLHGAVPAMDGLLRIWGEAAPEEGRAAGRGAFPFDAGPRRLASTLDATPGGFLPDEEHIRPARIWLPSRGRQPVASTPLVAAPPAGKGELRLRPWRVSALALELEEALTLLASLQPRAGGRRTVVPGVLVARDLDHWKRVARFALELVAEERFLPEVTEATAGRDGDGGRSGFHAVWRPVVLGRDAARLAAIVREMPAAAMALEPTGVDPGESRGPGTRSAGRPPAARAADAVRAFLNRMTDHVVRSGTWEGFSPPPPPRRAAASPDEAWVRALCSGGPGMDGRAPGMAGLRSRVRGWRRAVAVASDAPFRLCFRLEEPLAVPAEPGPEGPVGGVPEGAAANGDPRPRRALGDPSVNGDSGNGDSGDRGGGWRMEVLIQSNQDPSLRVPLRALRESGPDVRRAFGPWEGSAGEMVLASLGQAVAVSGILEGALSGFADSAELTDEEAYRFLTEDASALEQAGFPVLLPAWWVRGAPRANVGLRAQAETPPVPGRGLFSLEALVTVRWEAVLGGEVLSPAELERLAALKVPLVRVRGEWIQVDTDAILRVLARVARPSQERVRDLLRMELEGEEDDGEGGRIRATGWVGELFRTLGLAAGAAPERDLPAPRGFRGTLRPYQLRGYAWLSSLRRWGLGACLADDMGLGKTIQALALVQRDRETLAEPGPVLLVCPTSVLTNWRRESERFAPALPAMVHHGPDRAEGTALAEQARRHALVLTSYGLLHRDDVHLRAVRWAGVILDEAQNVKNPDTKQARAARSLEAGYRVALTGTPVENHVGELWSLMEFLNPGLLGSRKGFRQRFLLPIQGRGDPAVAGRLRRLTAPFVLRRAKTDPTILPELPDKIERRQYCSLTPEQATLYRAVLADAEERLQGAGPGIERRGLILGLLTRLKQVCNHPAHFLGDGSPVTGRSGKLERLTELAGEMLEAGDRALVFTQYVEMGHMLRAHLQETFGREALFLHGSVARPARDEMVERFQADDLDGPAFFLLSLRAGGTGLNLTAASHVFHYDRWWNPAVEDQATDRAHRIGQARTVQVHKLVCSGTLEERIDDLIESKKEVARAVVGGGEAWITELDDDRLSELLALSEDALEDEAEDEEG